MQSDLNLKNVAAQLSQQVVSSLKWQITTAEHPAYGAMVSPDSGLPEASHGGTIAMIAACGLLAAVQDQKLVPVPAGTLTVAELAQRMDIALDYALQAQRPSGLTDLRSTNYDSSPDTGFNVQALCSMVEFARNSAALAGPLQKAETFIRRAVAGIKTGGFHTPNHRWVMTSAMAHAAKLYTGLDVDDAVKAYLAEGFDADEEGAYIERSVSIYDTVSNRALLLIADFWDDESVRESALAAVQRNLDFDLHLIHADGTAETGLSRRQDYGTRTVPSGMIGALVALGQLRDDARYIRAAQWLYATASAQPEPRVHATGLLYDLLKYGEPEASTAEYPTDFVRYFPKNQIWRVRRGDLSVSAFGSVTRLLTMSWGSIQLSSIKISQTYFGVGHFIAETMTAEGDSITLHSSGVQKLHKPGYELPLGRPVDPEKWEATFAERDYRPLPPAESSLRITALADGLDFDFKTLDGLDQVAVQIALDFPAGGVWETHDTALMTQPGQTIFLKNGDGVLRFGADAVRIGPGADGHRYHAMRHAEPVPGDHVRILLTFLTPVDHQFRLRLFSGVTENGTLA